MSFEKTISFAKYSFPKNERFKDNVSLYVDW